MSYNEDKRPAGLNEADALASADDFIVQKAGEDFVSRVPFSVIETLIASLAPEDGDDGQGVPTGGTEGQVLAKASATDFDTTWVNQSGGEGGSFTVATPEEINTGEDNEKGVTPQGLADSFYPRVYRQDEEPTLADGDVWVNTGEEEIDTPAGEGGQTEEFDNGNSGTAVTIDWNNGRHQKLTLTDDCAITFTDPQFVGRYDVRIIQGNGGEHNITSIPGIFLTTPPIWTQGEEGDEIVVTFRFDGTKYIVVDTGYYTP